MALEFMWLKYVYMIALQLLAEFTIDESSCQRNKQPCVIHNYGVLRDELRS